MAEIETFTLKEPVTVLLRRAGSAEEREETITELQVHPFKAKDLRAIDGITGEGSQALALLARMTRQPIRVIDEIGGEDMVELSTRVERFLPSGLLTGATG